MGVAIEKKVYDLEKEKVVKTIDLPNLDKIHY
jgi:hypothetical protein